MLKVWLDDRALLFKITELDNIFNKLINISK